MAVELLIRLGDDGKVTVTGPIENRLVCYGLLVEAKDAIATFAKEKASQPAIVRASALPPPGVKVQ